jgi:vacuolar protein sorting-associated protein 26
MLSIFFFSFLLGSNVFTENETIAKYEIMDGAPVKGESIPIRVFLAGYDLTPTMRDINKKFSVRYFLNLVLMDTEDRRYFKQQEITLWRKSEKTRKSLSNSGSGAIGAGSSGNLTVAQQNAQMPTHLVQGPSSILPAPLMENVGGPLGANSIISNMSNTNNNNNTADGQTSPGASQTDQSNMGLFTEEQESPQHEATGSKVRSNPLAFDTDDDKTPSKEEAPPIAAARVVAVEGEPTTSSSSSKVQHQQSDESSSLFEFTNDAPSPSKPAVAAKNSNNDDSTVVSPPSDVPATDGSTNN